MIGAVKLTDLRKSLHMSAGTLEGVPCGEIVCGGATPTLQKAVRIVHTALRVAAIHTCSLCYFLALATELPPLPKPYCEIGECHWAFSPLT